MLWDVGRQIVRLLVACVCLAGLLYGIVRGEHLLHPRQGHASDSEQPVALFVPTDLCDPRSNKGRPIQVEMATSPDILPWLDSAGNQFSRLCPNVHVKLIPMDDLAAAREILAGQLHPTIWAPTDEISLRYLEHARRATTPKVERTPPIHLLESPLVLLIWEDRLKLLSFLLREEKSAEGSWVRGLCAGIPRNPRLDGLPLQAMTPGKWADWYGALLSPQQPRRRVVHAIRPAGDGMLPPLSEVERWGVVKIGYTWPTRYVGGIATLYLLGYEYLFPPGSQAASASELAPDAMEAAWSTSKDSLRTWLRRCGAGLEFPAISEQALTETLFSQGPPHLDAVVTYEHLALPLLERIDANAQALRRLSVVYPRPTLVSRHPALVFQSEPEQQEAVRRWLSFLRSPAMQELAIPLGFRPANKDVSIREDVTAQNRFLRLRRYGVLPALHLSEAPSPSGRVVEELIEIWGEATGRN